MSSDELRAWSYRTVDEALGHVHAGNLAEAIATLGALDVASVDERVLELTDPLLQNIAAGRRIIASFDPARLPSDEEVVIIYGNYPHMFASIVVNNPIRRHVADFWNFQHDVVEYDPRWERVDQILIINSDRRVDRWDSILRELASARAPIQRVTRVSAFAPNTGEPQDLGGTVACLRSHIDALRISQDAGSRDILVLEDDFSFTSSIDDHLADLGTFFERDYEYWVCLLGTSKFGPVVPLDDLVSRSFQDCTNAEAYLVSSEGRSQLLPLFEESLHRLKETGDVASFAADRCWAVLQPSGNFLVFRRKFGFQVSSFSDIEGSISRYLD